MAQCQSICRRVRGPGIRGSEESRVEGEEAEWELMEIAKKGSGSEEERGRERTGRDVGREERYGGCIIGSCRLGVLYGPTGGDNENDIYIQRPMRGYVKRILSDDCSRMHSGAV